MAEVYTGGSPSRPPSSGLPYGTVMATGVSAHLVFAAGMPVLHALLVGFTIAQALLIAAYSLVWHARSSAETTPPPAQRFGLFTIPIGAAVIGINLAGESAHASLTAAVGAVALGWLATTWLLARVVAPLARRPPGIAAVDGTWFLAPAALLVDAIGVAALLPRLPAGQDALGWLALAIAAAGMFGYAVLLALAAARVRAHALAGTGRASWWISAGGAGLAAAAAGRIGNVAPNAPSDATDLGFARAALVLWTIASLLLIPVLAGSLRHLRRLRRPFGAPVWPPTFSTGVYALGAGQAATLNHLSAVQTLYHLAAISTLTLWAITTGLALARAAHNCMYHARHKHRT